MRKTVLKKKESNKQKQKSLLLQVLFRHLEQQTQETWNPTSKLEKWLEEQLTKLYPDLEFHFNRKDTINSELDIYIPSLRLGFELNGIYHYEPIHGSKKLASIQSNDHRKMLACAEKNIELCVIDASSMTHFKPKRALVFLNIISSIINSKGK